jgi:preprotein translocase subunit SecE
MRRAQQRAEKRQQVQQRQATSRPQRSVLTGPSSPEAPRPRRSLLKPRWAMDIIAELRKVTWPTRQEVFHLTTVVLVVSAIIGVLLGFADIGFSWVVEQTILR